ncbi:hypothetical protein DES53_102768 [Roseimicrobium gellanilyticum]|uniref:Uncharacterized protein n=1 Tax=Roseimicrobium gellanilyticum TaxID=748857 RepID=A0A366HUJ0_9BACT|nr:hypothetical protein DES53_102768 [Roseimicrobium gellanilyticum]
MRVLAPPSIAPPSVAVAVAEAVRLSSLHANSQGPELQFGGRYAVYVAKNVSRA